MPARQAAQERNKALTLALRALRQLYKDYPELIKETDRGSRIILALRR